MTSPWNCDFADAVCAGHYDEILGVDVGFEVGDVVALVTGSTDFVITAMCEECGDVEVAWYDDHGGMQFASLPEEALVYAE